MSTLDFDVILLGAPGAGKGTQSKRIAATYGLKPLSTGELLRKAVASATPLGLKAKSYMTTGALVPDEVMIGVVRDMLVKLGGAPVLFDGFPRTLAQGRALDALIEEQKRQVRVVGFEVPQEELLRRLSSRWTCPKCQSPYTGSGKCKNDDIDLIQREDDKAETVKARLETYREQTAPLIDYYKSRGNYQEIVGMGSVDEVWARIEKVLSP